MLKYVCVFVVVLGKFINGSLFRWKVLWILKGKKVRFLNVLYRIYLRKFNIEMLVRNKKGKFEKSIVLN